MKDKSVNSARSIYIDQGFSNVVGRGPLLLELLLVTITGARN